MRPKRIGLIALLTLLATLTIDNCQLIQNPKAQIPSSQVLAQTPSSRKAEADRLLQQGIEQYQTSQFEAALKSWEQALIIYRELQDRQAEAATLGHIGLAYFSREDHAKAIDYQQQSLALAQEIQDQSGQQTSLRSLRNTYEALNNALRQRPSRPLSIQSNISANPNLQASEPEYLGNQALIYLSQGNFLQAIEYQQQSLSLITAQRNERQKARAEQLLQQGVKHYRTRQFEAALQSLKQALAIYQEVNERQKEGVILGYIGNLYYTLGDYDKATEYQQRYLTIAREFSDRIGEAQALGNIGIGHKGQGDYHSAISYIEKYLEMAREIKDRTGEQQALANLGNAYCLIGDCVKAIDYHQQSLALAREIKDRRGEAQALGSLGTDHYVLGDLKRAIDYLRQSLTITREIQEYLAEGQALNNLGLVLLKSGNLTEAETTLRTGIQVWESLRAGLGSNDANKVSIFETQISTYILLQKVLITQNKLTQALEIAERGRARAFVELLARRNTTTSDSAKSPIAPPTIGQLQQIAKEQNATLVEYSIINDDFKINGKQKPQESALYIWVISPTGDITFRSSDLQPLWQKQNTTLADLVTVSRESIGVRAGGLAVVPKVDEATQTNRLQQLHQILIQPIADLLPTNPEARVIFMPQSSLFLVPFPALQDEQRKYLIEKHTILTAPSIQVLELTRKQRQRLEVTPMQGKDALIVGNPIMPSVPPYPGEKPQPLAPLPGAEAEAKSIASLLNTKALIGKDATKSAITQLMPKARIIHLATHGLLDDVRGIGSALALAPSEGRFALAPDTVSSPPLAGEINGLLTAEQILDMKLNAELVVLSACDTGRGRITGDGVIGLSRSFISAGVPSVLVSLWQVPDGSTAFLMTEFYQNLRQYPNKAQALRQAMLTTMKQHPNPRNWAAFTLIGESD